MTFFSFFTASVFLSYITDFLELLETKHSIFRRLFQPTCSVLNENHQPSEKLPAAPNVETHVRAFLETSGGYSSLEQRMGSRSQEIGLNLEKNERPYRHLSAQVGR
jgi:hypothetical protein